MVPTEGFEPPTFGLQISLVIVSIRLVWCREVSQFVDLTQEFWLVWFLLVSWSFTENRVFRYPALPPRFDWK